MEESEKSVITFSEQQTITYLTAILFEETITNVINVFGICIIDSTQQESIVLNFFNVKNRELLVT